MFEIYRKIPPRHFEICLYSGICHASHPELDILSAELEGAAEENNGVEHNNKKYLASYDVTNHTSRATEKCDPALSCALKFELCSGVRALSFCWGRLLANWALLLSAAGQNSTLWYLAIFPRLSLAYKI